MLRERATFVRDTYFTYLVVASVRVYGMQ